MAASGARVCAVDVDGDGLRALEETLRDPDRHAFLELDVLQTERCGELVDRARDKLGNLYALVHAAEYILCQPLDEVTDDDWDLQVGANLKSAFFLSRAAAVTMIEQGQGGRIVNFTTCHWTTGSLPNSHAYTAAKTGLVGLTRAFAREYGPHGILVNAVSVGSIATAPRDKPRSPEQLAEAVAVPPMTRAAYPEEIANVVVFLCSKHASFVSGAVLNASGGVVTY